MRVLLRLLKEYRPHLPAISVVIFVMLAGAVMQTLIPAVIGRAIDSLRPGEGLGPANLSALWIGALSVLALAVGRGALQYVQTLVNGTTGQKILYALRGRLYRHLQYLPFSFFDQSRTGQLLSRVTADVESLRQFMSWAFAAMIAQGFVLAFIATWAFMINARLAAATMLVIPFLAWGTFAFSRAIRPAFRAVQQETAEMNTVAQEALTGIRVVKAFTQEPAQERRFAATSSAFLEANLRVVQKQALYGPALDFIANLGMVGVLWYGGSLVARDLLSVGSMAAFSVYLLLLMQPIRMLGFLVGNAQQAIAAGARVYEILDTGSDIQDAPDARPLEEAKGHVRFEGVSFAYGDKIPVLHDIDLDVPPGTTVALVGSAGSGKTTLVNLIPRFYDPTAGRVTIDGRDVRGLQLASLRRHVGIVPQDPYIFSLSILENIAFGREDATREEVIEAAKAADIHDFIMSLPEQYETVVGERGVGLSGGQRQRVAIARALLTDPAILILDDSLSSVDTGTERRIQSALAEILKDRTAFIIAHRLSSVRMADLVVVLDEGRIVQMGAHDELLAQPGLYRDIVETQLTAAGETLPVDAEGWVRR